MKQDETAERTPEQQAPIRVPRQANEVFGERLTLAKQFADILADSGVTQGLIGPREAPRLWERHLLNCAVVEELLPHRTRLIDVGSGAGLPGLVLALMRPDLDVRLVEPMLRRTRWLESAIEELGLINVTVHRGRAEEFRGRLQAQVVTARAVARLGQLATWCLPLLAPGGRLLALKGESAQEELDEDRALLQRLGVTDMRVVLAGKDVLATPTRVVSLTRPSGGRGGSAPIAPFPGR